MLDSFQAILPLNGESLRSVKMETDTKQILL